LSVPGSVLWIKSLERNHGQDAHATQGLGEMGVSGRPTSILKLLLVAIVGGAIGAGVAIWLMRSGGGLASPRLPYIEAPPAKVPIESTFTEAIRKAEPAVVSIETRFSLDSGGKAAPSGLQVGGRGSGIIIDGERGYVLTNSHVVNGARQVKVRLSDGREFEGRLIGQDTLYDIALLEIKGTHLPTAVLGRSRDLPVGAWVIAIGNPLFFERSVTAGIVSGKGRYVHSPEGDFEIPDLLQTDAAINLGNSGGALVNLRGEVVGIPTAVVRAAQAEGLGFAVPIDRAKAVVQELLEHGRVRHPWLGVLYSNLPSKPAQAGWPKDGRGALLLDIARGSPAYRAGLRKGEVVRRAGGKEILRREDLREVSRGLKVGERLPLVVWRAGRERKITLVVGEMPDPMEINRMFPSAGP